jgi:tRNA A37 methylthiotransferase MiaB
VERIRERIPGVSIATDIIVGFPGETEAQFQRTYDLLAELKLDVAHLARYSTRPGTVATRRMPTTSAKKKRCAASACWKTCRSRLSARSTPATCTRR